MMSGNQGFNPMQMVNQLRQSPASFFARRGFNVPQSMYGDPQAMINHLVQTGQVSQDAYNRARQMMQIMGGGR